MSMQIQVKRGTASSLTLFNPVLAAGEVCLELDTGRFKFGDGVTAWNSLPYHPVNVVASPAEITANQNNYNPGTGDTFRLTADAARNITGVVARVDGEAILLINVGSTHAITLKHADTDSTDVNRLLVPWAGDYVIAANGGAALLMYDGTTARWRVI